VMWTTCMHHEFEIVPPSASLDRQCASIKNCSLRSPACASCRPSSQGGDHESCVANMKAHCQSDRRRRLLGGDYCIACDDGYAGNTSCDDAIDFYRNSVACLGQEWEATAPVPGTSDRECTECTTCQDGSFEVSDCDLKSNRVCQLYRVCGPGEIEMQPGTAFADRWCGTVPPTPAPKSSSTSSGQTTSSTDIALIAVGSVVGLVAVLAAVAAAFWVGKRVWCKSKLNEKYQREGLEMEDFQDVNSDDGFGDGSDGFIPSQGGLSHSSVGISLDHSTKVPVGIEVKSAKLPKAIRAGAQVSVSNPILSSNIPRGTPVSHAPLWVAIKDPSSGKTYYANTKTRETTWVKPEGVNPIAVSRAKGSSLS